MTTTMKTTNNDQQQTKEKNDHRTNLADLPSSIVQIASDFDTYNHQNGNINKAELISALQTIQSLRRRSPPPPTNDTKNHTTMRITMGVMCITILFVAATFGVAIVAAFWAKDTIVNVNGVWRTKHTTDSILQFRC